MTSHPQLQGLLLAGGSSRRFGRDKLTEPIAGRPLLFRPLSLLVQTCEHVYLSVAPERKVSIEALLTKHQISVSDILEDPVMDCGPLAGIREGFKAVETRATESKSAIPNETRMSKAPLLVVAGDLPALSQTTIEALINAYKTYSEGKNAADSPSVIAARSEEEERVQPLCAIWMPSAFPLIVARLEAGERSVFGVLDRLDVRTVDVPSSELININRPSDLDLLSQM